MPPRGSSRTTRRQSAPRSSCPRSRSASSRPSCTGSSRPASKSTASRSAPSHTSRGMGKRRGGHCPVIVYAPLDTDEVVHPERYAAARIVTDDATQSAPSTSCPRSRSGRAVRRVSDVAPASKSTATRSAPSRTSRGRGKGGTPTVVPEVPPPPPHPTHSIAMITQASLLKKASLSSWVYGLLDGMRRSRAASRLPNCRDGSAIVSRDY